MNTYQPILASKRKDVRKYFNDRHIFVDCETEECKFNAFLANVSASGVFIKTEKPLKVGQEIAMVFSLSISGQKTMATGEVARTDYSGAGVEIKILFRND